jgi:hypothetical protein
MTPASRQKRSEWNTELAHLRGEEEQAENRRKDVERRWREFGGPGLTPGKEWRAWNWGEPPPFCITPGN